MAPKFKFGQGKIQRRKRLIDAAKIRWLGSSQPTVAEVRPNIDIPSTSGITNPVIEPLTGVRPSASKKKIEMFDNGQNMATDPDFMEDDLNLIINFKQLNNFVNKFPCSVCHSKSLTCKLLTEKREGIVNFLYTVCQMCGVEEEACATSPRLPGKGIQGKTDFLLNKRIVSGFVSNGQSYAALDHFCGAMNMHSMSHKTFDHHASSFQVAAIDEIGRLQLESAKHVRKAYQDMNPSIKIGDDTVLDICVSYDGTWRKRGHTSNQGIGIVIDVVTGLVLDFEIISLYCPTCDALVKRKNLTQLEKENICNRHLESGQCQKNFKGSSNAMEAEAAIRIWSRSLENLKLRYTELLSDGDAKTHSKLVALDPYPGKLIVKDECINHIQKRMGTALRKLIAEEKAKGVTLGGRGKLSAPVIDKLTTYYGKAIRDNVGDLEGMRAAVFATAFHIISTDEEHYHQRCPSGEMSWCFYNRAIAKGEEPGPHKGNMKTMVPKEIVEKVMDVYKRLGDLNLLQRCMKGKTQNANESLHAKIWSRCSKVGFSGRRLLDSAVAHGIAEFNAGAQVLTATLGRLNINAGRLSELHSQKRDKLRIGQSLRRATENSKEERLARKRQLLLQQDNLDREEGHLYAAGDGD